jgi:hypothetical protein
MTWQAVGIQRTEAIETLANCGLEPLCPQEEFFPVAPGASASIPTAASPPARITRSPWGRRTSS